MTDADLTAPSPARRGQATGYAKGDAARQRLLDAALGVFGNVGFRSATTRAIAEAAGVQLPAIAYYFGHKEGLYLACAEVIAAAYHRHLGPAAGEALAVLARRPAPAEARAALVALMDALLDLVLDHEDARRWAAFIARETSDRGPAYEVLYQNVWAPGTDITARLIAALRGAARPRPEDRVQAVLLIAGVMTFQAGHSVSRRLMAWDTVGPAQRKVIARALRRQIDSLGPDGTTTA